MYQFFCFVTKNDHTCCSDEEAHTQTYTHRSHVCVSNNDINRDIHKQQEKEELQF